MPNLFHAKEELKFAKEELMLFQNDKNPGFGPNKHWNNFLSHLDLSFIKAERGCQDVRNIFEPFQGKYKRKRKIDPLLSYLKNSRDASQHGIDILVSLEIVSRNQIDSLKLSELNKDGSIKETREVPLYPAEMQLKSFFINNKTWTPPFYHQGKKLRNPTNPIYIGKIGLTFYKNFITETEKKFGII